MDLNFNEKNPIRECLVSEVLTDILSFLSRKDLIKNIEPINKYFFKISNKNVKSIHLIQKSGDFIEKLANNLEEAKQQYLHLTSSECSLSEHFSLNNIWNVYICFGGTENNQAYYKRRRRYQMCVIRHSLDLFQHCHILLSPIFSKSLTSTDVQEIHTYLNILESVNPSQIELNLQTMNNPIPFNLRYWLTQNLLQSESTADHKPFIFGFCSKTTLNEFYLENNKSKEIILLENLKPENGLQTVYYLLRRCELNKEKNQREYCQKMFKTFKEFRIEKSDQLLKSGKQIICFN
uniref:F-box domain-containing protein n=1 Tax=Meloidogyne hapla TaxID=6305 RepID=A0A1I8BCE1_MELHA